MQQDNLTDVELHAQTLDGDTWRIGSLYSPGLAPPHLNERATMVANRVPQWAIAAGHTAGWVWSGLGTPEPWNLVCATQPALSPLVRTQWKPRARETASLDTTILEALCLLTPEATTADLLTCPGDDQVCAAQLFTLTTAEKLSDVAASCVAGLRPRQRDRARIRISLVRTWWSNHPFVTL